MFPLFNRGHDDHGWFPVLSTVDVMSMVGSLLFSVCQNRNTRCRLLPIRA